ncbi:hypothetical protein NDS46_31140 (plasmid) [Paenibacillus thiaminolyticus]|uniref:hypothetical protein n=1 Tax=Paenibacillus thiaminolyticus TaxID=49283 RepID=UPI00232EFB38|nr:hypothetical protein [Paenibacillus thiaminolyticus]WCF11414.1 hypothetical protein NDS46_31140 [Paenibacillus thiaminolyticus]
MDFTLVVLIVFIFLALVIAFLVKSFLKFVLIGVIAYVLFHIGFIWGVDDLNNKLQLSRWFNEEANQKIQDVYSDFTEKRDEHGVVNTEEVKKALDDTIRYKEDLLNKLQEKLKEIKASEK